jgi:hypothetical protein
MPTSMQVVERGYGFAVFNYTDIDPDALNATARHPRRLLKPPDRAAPDEWGAIAAWGWGRAASSITSKPIHPSTRSASPSPARLALARPPLAAAATNASPA